MVMVVGVMPGADAVSAAFELLLELALELELDEHAATPSAATVAMAIACQRCR